LNPLPRYTIDISRIDHINAQIEVIQRMINWYEDWKERNDPYEYVDERIATLNGQLAEYLIAREFAKEGVRTYGLEEEKSYNKS
jgi:hypothetical protein